MKPFAVYPDSFDGNTLGLWRFGERGGRLAATIGPAFTAGAGAPTPTDRGILFAAADQLSASLPGQPSRTEGTVECWLRYDGAENGAGYPLTYQANHQNVLSLLVRRQAGTGFIRAQLAVGDVNVGQATWSGADARAVLDSPEMIHVAGTFDSVAGYLRLFVNGVQRAEDLAGILALPGPDDYRVLAPQYVGYTGLLDEVRVSSISRYVGGADGTRYFTPARFQDGERAGLRGPGETVEIAGGCV